MIVDPIQNILVDRESGEPLMIDFGRGAQLTKVVNWLVGWFVGSFVGSGLGRHQPWCAIYFPGIVERHFGLGV